MNLEELQSLADTLRAEIGKAVHGQDEAIDMLLTGIFARGHVLLEGPPGTAKTLLAQSLSAAMTMDFGRIQFTPDLMPGDVLGANIFDFGTNQFRLTKGPVFTDILLADEINRAPPKTQAALLQVMNERVATIDGVDHSRWATASSSSRPRTRSSSRAPIPCPRRSWTGSSSSC